MNRFAFLVVLATASATATLAQHIAFKDPVGDDTGPGAYTYPTDPVYRRGSFDLTAVDLSVSGEEVEIAVTQGSQLEDTCLSMRSGFCVQMVFVFVQTDPATAHTEGLPGLNVQFAPGNGWNKVVIMSPQPPARVRSEVEARVAKTLRPDVIVPVLVTGQGRTITARVEMKDLGAGDPWAWGYQALMQSNDGYPAGDDLLTRKVNEHAGQHRFGGGSDGDCDPHVIDLLAGDAAGDAGEAEAQHTMLAYECNPDGTAKRLATLTLVHPRR